MTLNFDHTLDLDLGVSRSESEIALSQEWNGRLTWNEKDVSHPFMTMILISVTMVGWADVPDNDRGDFRHRRAFDISSLFCVLEYLANYYHSDEYSVWFIFAQQCRRAVSLDHASIVKVASLSPVLIFYYATQLATKNSSNSICWIQWLELHLSVPFECWTR